MTPSYIMTYAVRKPGGVPRMPIYNLRCSKCSRKSQIICKTNERNNQTCTALRGQGSKICEGRMIPVIGKCSFALSGTGWYRDGYN